MVDIQWLIGGEAGYGIMTVGQMMSKIFTRLGLSVFDYVEYPSLIRGGHNAYYVRASDVEIFSQKRPVDILVALNKETIDRHKNELSPNAFVIYDPNSFELKPEDFSSPVVLLSVPLLEITKKIGADKVMINTVSVGASLALFSSNYQILGDILNETFGRKGEKVIAENVNTTKSGFDYVKENFKDKITINIEKKENKNILIGGAETVAFAAIRAGLKFAAIYPMTPINTILTTLASNASKYGIVVKEPEDEIAGIGMVIGASFAGARSMTATSGGGFSLMVESLGLAAQAETPLVVVEGQRPGPATGFPTWTAQGDLRFVMHAAQGDFPRIVVAPGDMNEAFEITLKAFNLADKYQLIVIILVDKYLMEAHASINLDNLKNINSSFKIEKGKALSDEEASKEADYKRYIFAEDGVSPRSFPGQQGGIALNGSDEHDEKGLYNETSENRIKMMDKRFKKLESALSEIPQPKLLGNPQAPLTIVSFGSTKMPALEAIKWLKQENIEINLLNLSYILPFPQSVSDILKNAKNTLIIEGNKTGQLEGVIRENTGFSIQHSFRKYDGRPFYPEEIVAKVKEVLAK